MSGDIVQFLPSSKGHFLYESGHHGELWLDLELLYLRPEGLEPFAEELASKLAGHRPESVCGPLVEGAFVALTVASRLGVPFTYSVRTEGKRSGLLFPFEYRIPAVQRPEVRGKRVAIVNDVTNAGSAVRGTFADLQSAGAIVVAIGSLVVLGSSAVRFASDSGLALETLVSLPNPLWVPSECPLCAQGIPLIDRSTT